MFSALGKFVIIAVSLPSSYLPFLPSSPTPHFHRTRAWETTHYINPIFPNPILSSFWAAESVDWAFFFSGDILMYWHFWHLWKLVPRSSQELLLQVSLNETEKCLYFQIIIEPNVKLISTHFNNIWRKMHWTKLKLKILKI